MCVSFECLPKERERERARERERERESILSVGTSRIWIGQFVAKRLFRNYTLRQG